MSAEPRLDPIGTGAVTGPGRARLAVVIEQRERRRRRRKIILLVILILLLACTLWSTLYYLNNSRLPIPRFTRTAEEVVAPPEYLYSISGPPGPNALTRPVGVVVGANDRVYVADTEARVIRVYQTDGDYLFTFSEIQDGSETVLLNPAHLALDAKGNVYVSDRRLRAVYVFDPDGVYLRKITLESAETDGWAPLGMVLDEEGNLYVTDVGNTSLHRVIVFDPQGRETTRFGSTKQAARMTEYPGGFYFPNGLVVTEDGRLFVSDSDNRRVQVFDVEGEFAYFIQTSGIPRGMVLDSEGRLYVVDTLSHTVDVYELEGDHITRFGTAGIGPGQFAYPNDVALDRNGRIFVSDKVNHQVQVWGWPPPAVVVPYLPETPAQWGWLLAPLLLIPPLYYLLRKRRWAVTIDFVDSLSLAGRLDLMQIRRVRWITPEAMWPDFSGRDEGGVDLGEIVHPYEHSESDVRDLMGLLEVGFEDAVLLSIAKRVKRLCTQDERITEYAVALGVDVYDHARFIEEFGQE